MWTRTNCCRNCRIQRICSRSQPDWHLLGFFPNFLFANLLIPLWKSSICVAIAVKFALCPLSRNAVSCWCPAVPTARFVSGHFPTATAYVASKCPLRSPVSSIVRIQRKHLCWSVAFEEGALEKKKGRKKLHKFTNWNCDVLNEEK